VEEGSIVAPQPKAVTAKRGIVAGALAAVIAVAAFVAPWEGRELEPYRDLVGVWTVCYGHTGDVAARTYTPDECGALLRSDAAVALVGIAGCVHRPLSQGQWVALGSWTYNVGVRAACGSTLVRKINMDRPPAEWCKELLRWDRAGGRKVKGLTRRREAEYRECVE
jgi:lysozyme